MFFEIFHFFEKILLLTNYHLQELERNISALMNPAPFQPQGSFFLFRIFLFVFSCKPFLGILVISDIIRNQHETFLSLSGHVPFFSFFFSSALSSCFADCSFLSRLGIFTKSWKKSKRTISNIEFTSSLPENNIHQDWPMNLKSFIE